MMINAIPIRVTLYGVSFERILLVLVFSFKVNNILRMETEKITEN